MAVLCWLEAQMMLPHHIKSFDHGVNFDARTSQWWCSTSASLTGPPTVRSGMHGSTETTTALPRLPSRPSPCMDGFVTRRRLLRRERTRLASRGRRSVRRSRAGLWGVRTLPQNRCWTDGLDSPTSSGVSSSKEPIRSSLLRRLSPLRFMCKRYYGRTNTEISVRKQSCRHDYEGNKVRRPFSVSIRWYVYYLKEEEAFPAFVPSPESCVHMEECSCS